MLERGVAGLQDAFDALMCRATAAKGKGDSPYAYQRRLAIEGLPDLLRVPTGAGKTLAATLPWLYRRRFHPDDAVRQSTPRRLVIVLPQRALVEQTHRVIAGWLDNLGLRGGVGLHVLMGGASSDERAWLLDPAADAVVVGTQDMVLSRLLMRGYAEPHSRRPMSFGLLHASTQFVFDEVQLMGPARPTSLQLAALREMDALGTAAPCHSMWMSATVDPVALRTVDYGGPRTIVEIGDEDRNGPLQVRLAATRTVRRGEVATDPKRYPDGVGELVAARHSSGTRTIVVVNTVARAVEVYRELTRVRPAAELVLLHSRFRPQDRAVQVGRALDEPGAAGTIVVTTQVLEAGVDVSSRLLVTELAPWSSVVQRAGRCNREGEYRDRAELVWVRPPVVRGSSLPYAQEDLDHAAAALEELEGVAVTGTGLQERRVSERVEIHPVLRRRDLLDLFDTAPDLSGNDLDVTQWIRDADATTTGMVWRGVGDDGEPDESMPGREELCQVPVGELRALVGVKGRRAWVFDQADGRWRRAATGEVRPGGLVVLDAAQGGYLPDRGWVPDSRVPVEPVLVDEQVTPDGIGADPLTVTGRGRWVTVTEHLDDVRREVDRLFGEYGDGLPGLSAHHREAAVLAGLYHDVGKAHPVFANSLERLAGRPLPGGPWAKSGERGRVRHDPPHFRHELVSALMVADPVAGLLDGVAEADLVAYLVAAHHGKARLTIRSAPGENGDRVLGVSRVDGSLPVVLPDGQHLPALTLHREVLELGSDGTGASWQTRACTLRDRADVGPFRLAFLEAVVRVADWRVSARYDEGATS